MAMKSIFAAAAAVAGAALACAGGGISTMSVTGPSGWAGADAEARPLFEDGKTVWRIVVPDGASRYMRYAACELSNTVEKISGARLGIVETAEAPKRNIVRLTSGDTGELFDVFSVKTAPGEIVLHGNTPRGTLFAVYAFLRDRLDARWYWPGETGEFLPKMARFEVAEWEKEYRPAFGLREMSICEIWRHRHPDTERWFPKVFLNCGINSPEIRQEIDYVRVTSDHYVSLPLEMKSRQKMFDKHPDWFSMLNGKRSIKGIAGCWSNEEFRRHLAKNIAARLRANRTSIANLFPADVVQRCECASCTVDPDKSARWWRFYALLRDDIRRELPSIRFAGLGYQEYRDVPGIDIEGLEYVEYGQYNRCYYHFLGDANCPANVHSMGEFRRWAGKAPPALYGYEFDVFKSYVCRPLWRIAGDEMRVFRDMGLRRVKTELNVDLDRITAPGVPKWRISQLASRLSFYAWPMAAFDPDLDMDALLDDFCRHVYGAAAEPMKAYHNLIADAWGSMKKHITYYEHNPRSVAADFMTAEVEAKARELLAAAAKAAAGDKRAAGEVAIDTGCLEDWASIAEQSRKTRKGGVVLELPRKTGANAYDTCGWLQTKARRGVPQATRFKLYRGNDSLHLLADCEECDPGFAHGTDRHDDHDWTGQSIEIFIDTGNGLCHQIAVTPAGGIWDASDADKSWDSGAAVRSEIGKGKWMLDIAIPYGPLGGVPKVGDRWEFMAIRNGSGKFSSCGWPIDAHRDFTSAATLVFK